MPNLQENFSNTFTKIIPAYENMIKMLKTLLLHKMKHGTTKDSNLRKVLASLCQLTLVK